MKNMLIFGLKEIKKFKFAKKKKKRKRKCGLENCEKSTLFSKALLLFKYVYVSIFYFI